MEYTLKAGALYLHDRMLARIKNCFSGPEKRIVSADGDLLLQTEIRAGQDPRRAPGDVRQRRYSLVDAAGKEIAQAQPDYAAGDEPETVGWPVCRTPRVDHAQVRMEGDYELVMQNSQNYQLQQSSGETLVRIMHRGLNGGWDIETKKAFSPAELCGIFVFCRYIEQENEFWVV